MNAVGGDFDLPEDKQRTLRRAKRIVWLSIVFLVTTVMAVAFTAGTSQITPTTPPMPTSSQGYD